MSCQTESTFALENTHDRERAKPAQPVASPQQHFEITQGEKKKEEVNSWEISSISSEPSWQILVPGVSGYRTGGTAFIIGGSAGNSGIFNYPHAEAAVIWGQD